MELKEFIAAIGDDQAAQLFGVSIRTTQSWRLGDRLPRPTQANTIVTKTATHPKGPVTFAGIYGRVA